MKRFLSTIGILFYLIAISHVSINFHYCCDQLVDVAVNKEASCGHQSDEAPGCRSKSCCDNNTLFFDSETHVASENSNLTPINMEIGCADIAITEAILSSVDRQINARAGPPKHHISKRFLLFSTLLHYG